MIRVGFDIHSIGQQATGNETYTSGLLEAFTKSDVKDFYFTYYHHNANQECRWPGQYRRLAPRTPLFRIPLSTPYALVRDRIDVAHFQYFQPPVVHCPTVLTVHDVSFEFYPEFFSPVMSRYLKWLVPYMARRAAHIITVSEATKKDLIQLYRLPQEKISVIYNGTLNIYHKAYDESELTDRLARFNISGPFVICVGNLSPRKNQQRLVRCFAKLQKAHKTNLTLVLVGKPDYKGSAVLEEVIRQREDTKIQITGFVTQDELVALYKLAKFSIYPSLFEGFGLPIVESMACGTPVITSNCSCMPEIAGDAALLVDPQADDELEAAILRLDNDENLRRRLIESGLKRYKTFDWQTAGEQTLNIYREAAEHRK